MEAGARVAGSRFAYLQAATSCCSSSRSCAGRSSCSAATASSRSSRRCSCARRRCSARASCPTPSSRSTGSPTTRCTSRGRARCALASLHAGEMLDGSELPLRYAGFSPCFRREAGAAGRDTRGIFRVHQFDKVEMFSFVEPEAALDEHERLLGIEEEILQALEIPYRVVNIAVDDLGSSAVKKYDCEAWLPGQQRYREVTSTSNTTDFQSRRLDIRYRPARGAPAARVDAQRHRGDVAPHDRAARERPARGRLRRRPRGAADLGCSCGAAGRRHAMTDRETPITPPGPGRPRRAAARGRRLAGDRRPAARRPRRPRRGRRPAPGSAGVRAAAGGLAGFRLSASSVRVRLNCAGSGSPAVAAVCAASIRARGVPADDRPARRAADLRRCACRRRPARWTAAR